MDNSALLADPEVGVVDDLVDLDRYPIHQPDSGPWREATAEVRRRLVDDGIASLAGFLRPRVAQQVARSLDVSLPYVAIRHDRRGVYARDQLGDLPADDPRLIDDQWIAGHVTRDMIPPQSPIHRLYVSTGFKAFIADCVGVGRLFEYADPLAGLVVTVMPPGGRYGWHYDTNEFVVTIVLEQAEQGGSFDYCPNLRRPGDENLDGLRQVLNGTNRSAVRSLTPMAGDLQVFCGRYALHRVSPVGGQRSRLVAVLSYGDRAGIIGPADRTRRVYGRVTEAHLVAGSALLGADGLIL